MSDTGTPAAGASAGASALMNGGATPEPMSPSRSQAFERLDAMQRSASFQERIARSDPEALAELKNVRTVVDQPTSMRDCRTAPPEPGTTPSERQQILNTLLQHSDIPADVQAQFLARTPVSLEEITMATAERVRLMKDKAFVARWLDGGRAERTRMTLVNLILTSPIRQQQGTT